jgi:PadR family transcriptional regulator, regulatory protein PadR
MNPELENKITQLRKGILELVIMGFLYQESHYGYSLVKALNGSEGHSLREGTIYPILQRMMREGLLEAEWVESPQGPPRKYYRLTASGRDMYEGLVPEFYRLAKLVIEPSIAQGAGRSEDTGRILSMGPERA